jgi:hypothetical protein
MKWTDIVIIISWIPIVKCDSTISIVYSSFSDIKALSILNKWNQYLSTLYDIS